MKRFFAGIVLLVLLAGQSDPSSEAQPRPGFEDGLMAYHRGNPATALEIWRPLAEQGNAAAQYSVGYLYHRGEGVLPDLKQAAKWYRKAAKQGDPEAQLNLGLMYAQGEGVPRNYVQAYKWFSLSYLGYEPGEYRDMAFRNRENAASAMTKEQIAEAERLIRKSRL